MIALLVAAGYDSWVFYSRWSSVRDAERQAQARQSDENRRTLEMLGGGQLKILNFYPNPAVAHRGAQVSLCYGVYGAKSVRVEPPVEQLHPAISHCFEVKATKTMDYKLIAEDGAGHSANETATIQVVP
jgi:hypothetical protein